MCKVILAIILFIIFVSVIRSFMDQREGYANYCGQCGYLGDYDCATCINCGTCITANGYKECVPGDVNGPYFREDCNQWYYNSIPWYRHPYMWVNNFIPYYWPYYSRRGNRLYDRPRRFRKYGRRHRHRDGDRKRLEQEKKE